MRRVVSAVADSDGKMSYKVVSADGNAHGDASVVAEMESAERKETRPCIGVVTVSDRAFRGEYEDKSGPAIVEVMGEFVSTDVAFHRRICPDEIDAIIDAVHSLRRCQLVCTTGGTGPSARDVTPEAMNRMCDKLLPGFGEEMRRASLASGVPTAILSRQTAGIITNADPIEVLGSPDIRRSQLVVNLPGKPGSVRVCLDAVFPAIPYCVDLIDGPFLEGNPQVVKVFRPQKKQKS